MPGGHYVALSGMRTRLDELDRLASDLANVGTAGYQAERVAHEKAPRPRFELALETAVDASLGHRRLDTRAGAIGETGRDLDVAIEGPGYLTVETPAGPRYTRNGQLTRSSEGVLTTSDGLPVLGTAGPITLGPGPVEIDGDGSVSASGVLAGQLALVEFPDPGLLEREGSSLLRADGVEPVPAARSTVLGGSLEGSNVSVVDRMAVMTSVSRGFEALQKAMSVLMNDIDARAIDSIGRRQA